MKKRTVAIIFGGKSAEHEVSLQSARNVLEAIDRERFDVTLIGVDKTGRWLLTDELHKLSNAGDPHTIGLDAAVHEAVALVPESRGQLIKLSDARTVSHVDVVFPILHGPFGEDGTVQGLLKLAGVPFVGSGVLGSAVGMDKDVMKRLLRDAGLPVARFRSFGSIDEIDTDVVIQELGLPLFVKPANLGSSIGVRKVVHSGDLVDAIAHAFAYDTKILVEEFIQAREIECSVLGNREPMASCLGEIVPLGEFYSYEAKYIDEHGATLQVPAVVQNEIADAAREMSVKAFKVLSCDGLARVDFFLQADGKLILNEINTMPGFTRISMYPRLWESSGLTYRDLITRLIDLAFERFDREVKLKTSYNSFPDR